MDGYPATKKTNSGSCQRSDCIQVRKGEEGTLSGRSSFFKVMHPAKPYHRGNLVESELLELELESAKSHISLGE